MRKLASVLSMCAALPILILVLPSCQFTGEYLRNVGAGGPAKRQAMESRRQVERLAGIDKPQLRYTLHGDAAHAHLIDDGRCTQEAYAAAPIVQATRPEQAILRDQFGREVGKVETPGGGDTAAAIAAFQARTQIYVACMIERGWDLQPDSP